MCCPTTEGSSFENSTASTKTSNVDLGIVIVKYDPIKHGRQTGALWFQGLMEMWRPFRKATMLHWKVLSLVAATWVLHWLFLLLLSKRNSWSMFHYVTGTISVPILFALMQLASFAWLFGRKFIKTFKGQLRIHDLPDPKSGKPVPQFKGQWVALLPDGNSKDEVVVGCITLKKQPDDPKNTLWLAHVTVSPKARRQGLANRLVSLAETEALQVHGATKVKILVGNIHSRRFWLARGYKVIKVKWSFLDHSSVIMERNLVPLMTAPATHASFLCPIAAANRAE